MTGMLTIAQIQSARVDGVLEAAAEWRQHSGCLAEIADEFRVNVVGGVDRSGWTGPAATGAQARMEAELQELEAAQQRAAAISAALERAADEFRAAQLHLLGALDSAEGQGFQVHPDGSVEIPPDPDADPATTGLRQSAATQTAAEVRAAQEEATQADEQAVIDLRAATGPDVGAGGVGGGPVGGGAGGVAGEAVGA
ncbi:hypothetical protein ACIQGZ_00460 [Streptomyces sp. NPDC092296]|uniref:hypothetical protein n=1 Tax=Streptomyces sp. NPDC092296 TaxID=3366012 RepID=UPI00380071E7